MHICKIDVQNIDHCVKFEKINYVLFYLTKKKL